MIIYKILKLKQKTYEMIKIIIYIYRNFKKKNSNEQNGDVGKKVSKIIWYF